MIKKLKIYTSNERHRAIGLCFMLLSVLFAFWITRIPEVKNQLGLSEGDLGTALFFTPLGAITSMLLSTNLIRWIGEGKSTIVALLVFGLAMIAPPVAFNYWSLCAALFIVGFSMGWVDISMNAVANTIEKTDNVKIMSTSHGFFSLGGIVGGIIGGILASLNVQPMHHMMGATAGLTLVVALLIVPHIKQISDVDSKSEGVSFALPQKSLLGLAVIAFCIMMGEGAIADWSTVYLSASLSSGPAVAGFGFAAFSAMMTLGRFNGDYFIEKVGTGKVVKLGLTTAIVGLILLFFQSVTLAIAGFGLIGLGYSSVIPILFSKASQKKEVSPALGLASVATLGYFGFLIGPVMIGWLAEVIGLAFSFGLLVLLTGVALTLATRKSAVD